MYISNYKKNNTNKQTNKKTKKVLWVSGDSLVGSASTYSAVALQASQVWIPAQGPFPIPPPSFSPMSLPVNSDLSYHNNVNPPQKTPNMNSKVGNHQGASQERTSVLQCKKQVLFLTTVKCHCLNMAGEGLSGNSVFQASNRYQQ